MKKLVAEFRTLWHEGGRFTKAALATFCASMTIHLCALAGLSDLDLSPAIFAPPHLAVMLLGFAGMVRSYDRRYRRFRLQHSFYLPSAIAIPWRLVALTACLGLYTGGWMLYSITQSGEGSPQPYEGGFAWVNHGEVVRILSRAEYRRSHADLLAIFSAAWMVGSLAVSIWHHRITLRLRQLSPSDATHATLTSGAADAIVSPCPPPTSPASSTSSAPPKR